MSKFKVGDIWVSADGEVKFKILCTEAPNNVYPIVAVDLEQGIPERFTSDGKYYVGENNPLDLKTIGYLEHPKAEFLRALADGKPILVFDDAWEDGYQELNPLDTNMIGAVLLDELGWGIKE